MANLVYNRGKFEISNGAIDLDTSDLRVLLVQSSYTELATHNVVADIVASELSVVGYARQALANKTATEDDVNGFAYLDADDVVFTSLAAGQTIGGAVVFRHTGADATAPLLAFYDLTNTPTNGGNFTLQWASPANGGVLKLA